MIRVTFQAKYEGVADDRKVKFADREARTVMLKFRQPDGEETFVRVWGDEKIARMLMGLGAIDTDTLLCVTADVKTKMQMQSNGPGFNTEFRLIRLEGLPFPTREEPPVTTSDISAFMDSFKGKGKH